MSRQMRAVVLIPTYRREQELRRLLRGLATCNPWVERILVMDNAGDAALPDICAGDSLPVPIEFHRLAHNPGPGAAWKFGMQRAMQSREIRTFSHFLCLDDDVMVDAASLQPLAELADSSVAAVVAPLLEDAGGRLWGFPEPKNPAARKRIRACATAADALEAFGPGPQEMVWCTGACTLFRRAAIERCGFHRSDFYLLGEDLELSMRISAELSAVFTAAAVVPHLPPAPTDRNRAAIQGHIKFCSLLQNLSYLSLRVPHHHHMARYLPGNFKRFVRDNPFGFAGLLDAAGCFWAGAALGQPAGGNFGTRLRQKIHRRNFAG